MAKKKSFRKGATKPSKGSGRKSTSGPIVRLPTKLAVRKLEIKLDCDVYDIVSEKKDFTVCVRPDNDQALYKLLWERLYPKDLMTGALFGSEDASCTVTLSAGKELVFDQARMNAAACAEKSAIALTLRLKKEASPVRRIAPPAEEAWEDENNFPVSNKCLAHRFWELSNAPNKSSLKRTGLLIIAGSTNSGKTELLKAIVQRYLYNIRKPNDRPHLLTCEDPIESWFKGNTPQADIQSFRQLGISFTPRYLGKDVFSIGQSLKDARRQSPACYVIGEVRSQQDWLEIVDFAGSGHLIVVTTHAANLREAILRIFNALEVRTPQNRRAIANTLLGVVHAGLVESEYADVNGTVFSTKAQLPTVWMGSAAAVSQLTADGLSSVMPNKRFCYSRKDFIETIPLNSFEHVKDSVHYSVDAHECVKRVHELAFSSDLNELIHP